MIRRPSHFLKSERLLTYGVVDLATLSEDHPDENYESIGTPEVQLLGGYTPTQNPKRPKSVCAPLHYRKTNRPFAHPPRNQRFAGPLQPKCSFVRSLRK